MVITVSSSTKVKAGVRCARGIGELTPFLGGAALNVALISLGSLLRAHFSHRAGKTLSGALGSNGIVHQFLPLFVPLLFGECGPFTILADGILCGLASLGLLRGGKVTNSGFVAGKKSFGGEGCWLRPAKVFARCISGYGRSSRAIAIRAGGKKIN
jgi:hypothetical protein